MTIIFVTIIIVAFGIVQARQEGSHWFPAPSASLPPWKRGTVMRVVVVVAPSDYFGLKFVLMWYMWDMMRLTHCSALPFVRCLGPPARTAGMIIAHHRYTIDR
jgi:hypothetical protein